MSDLPPSRGRALAVCLLSLSLLAALAPSAAANPLTTQPEPAITMPVAVVSDASTALAAAAAAGAGGAVDGFLGDTVEGAAEALSVVATTALPERGAPSSARTDQVPAGDRAPWSGWQSGAAGPEAADGSFATYRGSPLGVVSVWCDSTAEAQTQLDAVDDYADYNGQMDVAVGALVTDETWKQAAAGDFVQRWTTAMQNLKAKRAGKGTTYVRIAHEFNGDWMTWGVNASNVADYIKGYRLYASIVRKVFPQAKLTWSPNSGNHNTLTMDQMWPGSDVVDVIGPDDYDGYPPYTSAAVWNATVNSWLTPGLTPRGLGAWQQYAARRGKPLAMPEWGMQDGDHPAYIQGTHDFLAKYAARPGSQSVAGQVVYDVYFNAEDKFKLTTGQYPLASALYASLKWGN